MHTVVRSLTAIYLLWPAWAINWRSSEQFTTLAPTYIIKQAPLNQSTEFQTVLSMDKLCSNKFNFRHLRSTTCFLFPQADKEAEPA